MTTHTPTCEIRRGAGHGPCDCGYERERLVTAPLDLAPIRARAEASTRGPWNTYTTTLRDATGRMVVVAHGDALAEDGTLKIPTVAIVGYDTEQAAPDATFIAASRADIPALLDEVERLRLRDEVQAGVLADVRAEVDELQRTNAEIAAVNDRLRERLALAISVRAEKAERERDTAREERDRAREALARVKRANDVDSLETELALLETEIKCLEEVDGGDLMEWLRELRDVRIAARRYLGEEP